MMAVISVRPRRAIKSTWLYLIAIIAAVVAVFPLYWLLITSIKTGREVVSYPPVLFPTHVTLQNYWEVFVNEGNGQFFINSLIVSVSSTIITVFIGSLAAYALAKTFLPHKFRHVILIWILLTRIFPPITTAIPYFVLISNLHLVDTYQALIITYVSYGLPFVIWLMLGFFQDLPHEIEEAATVDGCSMWQRFWRVVLPLALPALAVTSIFAFAYAWNEFLYASVLTSFNAKTLPVVIAGFISDKGLEWDKMSALGSSMILPILIFSALVQRYLVRGLTFGAVKG